MCPLCIGSAALILSSAGSAGGLAAALTLRSVVHRRDRSRRSDPTSAAEADRTRESFGNPGAARNNPRPPLS